MNRMLNQTLARKISTRAIKVTLLNPVKSNKQRWLHNNRNNSAYHHFSSLASLLKPAQIDLINEQKVLFDTLYKNLSKLDINQDILDLVMDSKNKIDDLFMVVVVGEFNAGKSTFINALLGDKYLIEGVLPTTSKIGILRSSCNTNTSTMDNNNNNNTSSISNNSHIRSQWRRAENILLTDVEEIDVPLDWLQHIAIIDTPGTNAIITKHELLTQKIVPRADLVLFVTSAERPMTESESIFLSKISEWGKKVVMIINKMDTLETAEDKQKVIDYVSQNASKALGSSFHLSVSSPSSSSSSSSMQQQQQLSSSLPVFAVSGKQGLIAKLLHKNTEINSQNNSITNSSSSSSSNTTNDNSNKNTNNNNNINNIHTENTTTTTNTNTTNAINMINGSSTHVIPSLSSSLLPEPRSYHKLWTLSNMSSIETYLKTVLGEQELIKNKILNPLTVADRIITDTILLLEQQKKLLEGDMRIIELIQENFVQFEADLDRDLKYYQTQIHQLFSKFQTRVDLFLENNMSITKYHVLWYNQELFLEQFKKEVLIDISLPLEQILVEVSELIATRCKNQANGVIEYIGQRPQRMNESSSSSSSQKYHQNDLYNDINYNNNCSSSNSGNNNSSNNSNNSSSSGSSGSSNSSASEMSRGRGDHASSRIHTTTNNALRINSNTNTTTSSSSNRNNMSSSGTRSSGGTGSSRVSGMSGGSGSMIGKIIYDNHFETTRADMLHQLQKDVVVILSSHTQQQDEIESMTKQISESYRHSGIIQGMSALSLGTLLSLQLLDITGIAFLTTTAFLSFFLIPTKKKAIIQTFHTKMNELQSNLDVSILNCFEKGKIKGKQQILDNISPYTRHVTISLNKIHNISMVMNELRNNVSDIQIRAQNIK